MQRHATRKTPLLHLLVIAAALTAAAPLAATEWTELSEGLRASDAVIVGGQPTEAVLREAAAAGVLVVVNFRGEHEDPGFDEEALAAELGLTYLRVPVAGPDALTPETVQLFDAVLGVVGDQPALMHCGTGNRVGALHALHAAQVRGWDEETAIEFGRRHGLIGLEEAVRARIED